MSVSLPLSTKISIAAKGILGVLKQLRYALLALLVMLLTSGLILWSLNFDLLGYIWFETNLSLVEKLDFFFDIYQGLYTNYESVHATGIAIFSILFGVNTAVMVYVLRHRDETQKVSKKASLGGLFFAVLGGGCIACGTSILAPLLATVGATSTVAVRELSSVLNWLGSLLIIYSLYRLGLVANYVRAKQK